LLICSVLTCRQNPTGNCDSNCNAYSPFYYGHCNGIWKCLTANCPGGGWYCGTGTALDEWGNNYYFVAWAYNMWDGAHGEWAILTGWSTACDGWLGGVYGWDCFHTGVNRIGQPFYWWDWKRDEDTSLNVSEQQTLTAGYTYDDASRAEAEAFLQNQTAMPEPIFPIRTDKPAPEKRTDLTEEEAQSRRTDCNQWCWNRVGFPGQVDNCTYFNHVCRGRTYGRWGNFYDFVGGTCGQFAVIGACSQCMFCWDNSQGRPFGCNNNLLNNIGASRYGISPGFHGNCPYAF